MSLCFKIKLPFLLFSFLLCSKIPNAQNPVLTLSESNVLGHQEFNQNIATGSLQVILTVGWRNLFNLQPVLVSAASANLSNQSSLFPASAINYKLISINGQTPGSAQLNGTAAPEAALSTSPQVLYTPASSLAAAQTGPIVLQYRIAGNNFLNRALVAGDYTVNLVHNQSNILIGGVLFNSITPSPIPLRLRVPSLNKWVTSSTSFTKNYSSLTDFTAPADLIFDLSTFTIGHTMPAYIDVKAQGPITFTPPGGGTSSTLPVNLVEVFGTGLTTTALSTTYQRLTGSALPVPVGNITNVPLKLKINALNVKSNLFKAGSYSFNADIRTTNADGTVSNVNTVTFTISSPNLSNISLQSITDVNFNYASAMDYQLDKSADMVNHLLISNNKSYEIYVRSTASKFTLNGVPTNVPSSIVRVENITGETGITARNISTTPQAIVSNAAPVLSKNLSIRYTIPASQATALIGQQTGAVPYILNVVYSFTNL